MIELTNHVETQEPMLNKTILSCFVRLDKKTVLEILNNDYITIHGKKYEIPETKLLHLLLNRRFGETALDLVEIKQP